MDTQMLNAQVEFFEKFGQMLNTGIPFHRSIEVLIEECRNPTLKNELIRMVKTLTARKSLMDMESKVFSRFVKEMVVAGESHGCLDLACARIARGLEAERAAAS